MINFYMYYPITHVEVVREIDPYDVFFLVPYETSQYSNMFPNKMVEQYTFYYMATVYGP